MKSNIKVRIDKLVSPKRWVLIREIEVGVVLWDYFKELINEGYMDKDTQLFDRVGRTLIYRYKNYQINITLLDIDVQS